MASSTIEEPKLPGGYLVTPRVPQGLAAAVEGLTREVIRHSPEDIYVFAAHHFEKLLILREQCSIGGEKPQNRDESSHTLREMSRALRRREIARDNARTTIRSTVDQVGWSLNQTAKVLKRHRSIFGDEGRRITTDEVFGMANIEKDNRSRSPKKTTDNRASSRRSNKEKSSCPKSPDLWKASTSRTERSTEDHTENREIINDERTRTGPRIITKIPSLPSGNNVMLAKDIKTELRKNRMSSSKERRNVRASSRPEDKNTLEKSDSKIVESSDKVYSSKKSCDKQQTMEMDLKDKRSRKNYYDSVRSPSSSSSSKERQRDADKSNSKEDTRKRLSEENLKKKRPPNIDRVKDYVVERFATAKSLEELQTSNYVEKVQEIIDETGPIIKDKIEQLKSCIAARSAENSDVITEDSSREKNQDSSRRKNSSMNQQNLECSTNKALLRTKLTETQNLLENVSSSITRSSIRSRSARNSRRTNENFVLTDDETQISRDSSGEASGKTGNQREIGLETRLSKTRDLLEDISSTLSKPTRRSRSAKYLRKYHHEKTNDNVSSRNDDDNNDNNALKKRLDETRNLLRDISATFPNSLEKVSSRNRTTFDHEESTSSTSMSQTLSKMCLPAMISMSVRNNSSNSGISRIDSDNLVLPAISPESRKSTKIRDDDLILPVLSSSGTSSSNENSSRRIDTNDDVPLKDFDILEISSEYYIRPEEINVDNVSRDSLNVTPDFDSIPQRPDSLEPVEIIDEFETKNFNVVELEEKIAAVDDLRTEIPQLDDNEAKTLEADNVEAKNLKFIDEEAKLLGIDSVKIEDEEVLEVDEPRAKTLDNNDLEAMRKQESMSNQESESTFVSNDEQREIKEFEKLDVELLDTENRTASSKETEKDADVTVKIMADSRKMVEELEKEIISIDINDSEQGKSNEAEKNDDERHEDHMADKLGKISPEPENYTYVLTEGSPYDIPDTVTTVIIPERILDSPLSDRLNVELENGRVAKMSLIPGGKTLKTSFQDSFERNVDIIRTEDIEEETAMSQQDKSMKNLPESIDKMDSSPKSVSDPFGEIVKPDENCPLITSEDIDFIREIEIIQDMHVTRQDLGRINEELSEDLEEQNDEIEIMKNSEKTRDDDDEISMEIEDIEKDQREKKKDEKNNMKVDESVTIESDLSTEVTRLFIDSESSSNETKESGPAEDTLELVKRENSLDDEAISSDNTRTPESSNEIKETTITDGLSFSLDPTRPFVPELNLDSLQDITVSSFKMTEEDYDNQERGDNENTNSITDTLNSDENNRTNENLEFAEEAAVECITVSSSGSGLNEIDEDTRNNMKEITEETIVKCRVEVKEDVCEKKSTYVTGPSKEEDNVDREEKQILEVDKENEGLEEDAEEKATGRGNIETVVLGKDREDTTMEEKEEIVGFKNSNDSEKVEIVEIEREEESTPKSEKEEITKMEDSNESEKVKIVEMEKEEESTPKSEKEDITKMEDSNESKKVQIVEMEKEGESTPKSEKEEITKIKDSNESEKVEFVEMEKEEESTPKSEKEEITKMEVSNESEKVKIIEMEKEEESTPKSEKEDITKMEDSNESKKVQIVEMEKEGESTPKSEKEEITKMKDSNESEKVEIVEMDKEEESTPKSEKEEITEMEDSNESEKEEIVEMDKEEKYTPKSKKEEMTKMEDLNESEKVQIVEMKKQEESTPKSEKEEITKMEDSNESEKVKIVEMEKEEESTPKSEKEEITKMEDSSESIKLEIVEINKEEESTPKSEKEEITKTEDLNESEKVEIVEMETKEDYTPKIEKEEITKMEDSNESAKVKIVKMDKEEESTPKSEKEEITKMEDSNESEKVKIVEMEKEEESTPKSEKEEITKMEDSNENLKLEIVEINKEEESTPKSEKEEITKMEDSNESEKVKIVKMDKEEESAPKSEKEEITKMEDSNESEKVKIVEMDKEEQSTPKSEKEEITKMEDSNESKKLEIVEMEKEEESTPKSEKVEIVKIEQEEEEEDEPDSSLSYEKLEYEVTKRDEDEKRSSERDVDEKLKISTSPRQQEIMDDIDGAESLNETILKNFTDKTEYDKTGDMNEEMPTEEEETDDILEDSYVDDETPLAVSRSASQCTTRRVSSGNLAKLREDPTIVWNEDIERENEETETDPSSCSSRVKFLRINDSTIKERGSEEYDESVVITRDTSDETNDEQTTKDSRKFHIYVPEIDASEENSTTESSTFDSAVTKIQAGVRGFLTRRRFQRGQQNRSSTLSGIPSIQDSVAIEPLSTEDQNEYRKASIDKDPSHVKLINSSPKVSSEDDGLVDAATRIQSNYRGYKARKRLRREDAVQRTTLSLEKSFAESGLQHTGEFHDCIPLPIHDIAIEKKTTNLPKNPNEMDKPNDHANKDTIESPNDNIDESADSPKIQRSIIDIDHNDSTTLDHAEMIAKTLIPVDPGQMFFGQSSNLPIVQFDTNPNVSGLVDLVVLAKDDDALQSGYLNFITSVEDTEAFVGSAENPFSANNVQLVEEMSNESMKEPLALSGPTIGAIIEEVTSSGAENFMNINEDQEPTMTSTNSSVLASEVIEETVSVSTNEHQADGNISSRSRNDETESGSSEIKNEICKYPEVPEKISCSPDLRIETESLVPDFIVDKSLSFIREKELLGPESSVDSMECPIIRAEEKHTSASLDSRIEESASMREITEETREKMTNLFPTSPKSDSSDHSEITEERPEEQESIGTNVDEATSSILSFSMKVEDLLGLGSEESVGSIGKKSLLEVSLRPGDLMKTKSISQESQLAGERIESPITMIQIAPERSESLKHDELSDNDVEEDTKNGKNVRCPSSEKFDEK